MDQQNPVIWFEIYVSDTSRSKAFYEAALGTTLSLMPKSEDSLEDMWSFPNQQRGGGASGALTRMKGAPMGPGGTIVYFSTEDCAATADRAVAAGGRMVKSRTSIGQYGAFALVADPDDNIIGFHSMT